MGTRCADHVTPLYPQKLALTSLTGGGRSVGIVRSRTKATEFSLVLAEVSLYISKLKNLTVSECAFNYDCVEFPWLFGSKFTGFTTI